VKASSEQHAELGARFEADMARHRLRREIVATSLASDTVDLPMLSLALSELNGLLLPR
jgi:NAD-specific glutamate dehydrogenase